MIVNFVFEIPPNTTQKTLLREVEVPAGLVTKAHVNIPPGWNYTAGVRVEASGKQILPTYGDDYISGNGLDVTLEPMELVTAGKLQLYGINHDPDNPHGGVIILEFVPLSEMGW